MNARPRRLLRWSLRLLLGFALLLLLAAAGLRWHLGRSLPPLDGEHTLAGLGAEVRVERDALGVPTIHAADRLDAARALGFLHAQDRFFGMDLNRRVGAGEVSALLGSLALDYDRWLRFFPGRQIAEAGFAAMPETDRALLIAYSDGVNRGLESLRAAPPEYLLPGARVEPWRPEDSILVALSMFYNLQDSRGRTDEERERVRDALPPSVVDYLLHRTSPSESPLDASVRPEPPFPVEAWAAAIEAASTEDGTAKAAPASDDARTEVLGSNAWAAGASATREGRAILANDMHLGLRLPHVWYRAGARFTSSEGEPVAIDGATLPGLPVWIVGSNRHVAWGFTNSYTDQTDLVRLQVHPDDPDRYRADDGWATFTERIETIALARGEPVTHTVRETLWGPVRQATDGRLYAVLWMGARLPRWDMGLDRMLFARDVDEALAVARSAVVPTQNLVLADRQGAIAWTLIGPLPDRDTGDGFYPYTAATIGKGWRGRLPADAVPVWRSPEEDLIWTANQRLVGGEAIARLGDGGYDAGYRGARIRDFLRETPPGALDEAAMLALQGDVEALDLRPWQALALATLDEAALGEDEARRPYRQLLAEWSGGAESESVAYLHLRTLRGHLVAQLRPHLAKPLGEHASALPPNHGNHFEEVVLEILRAPHEALRPPGHDSMRALVLASLDRVRTDLPPDATWGSRHRLAMGHDIFGRVPVIGRWFRLPAVPLPGDSNTVRVQTPRFGSSQRMVVSPGHEEAGFYHQPAGPSGHFLSPYFEAGHTDWVALAPSPFLPGPPVHTLLLQPEERR
jgi:penicillin G amidase